MPIPPATVGTELPTITFDWAETDAILYALGVGARPPAELGVLYERGDFVVLPTFSLIANWWAVKDLGSFVRHDGLPMVHAHQSLDLVRPLAREGHVEVRARISGLWEKGKHTLIELTSEGFDQTGSLFTATSGTMILGMHGWGGTSGPSAAASDDPDVPPTASVEDYVRPEQASIYRLSGDRNALHADPQAARGAGFDDVFLHGLCTLGFAARAITNSVGDGDALRLQSISCRFSSPVSLDESLQTDIWQLDAQRYAFQTSQLGRPALTRGLASLWRS